MTQITTCTFFKLEHFSNKFWAFAQMQLGHAHLKDVEGLVFYKLLGSGAENGFSSKPNFGTYALLCIWDSESKATAFFENNSFFKKYKSKSTESFTVYAHSAEAHGKWDGKQPFISHATLALDQPVMVLTRASIRITKLISFWRRVGNVSKSLEDYKGLVLSIGVGEWPLIQQATVSIWKTQAEMIDYAYKNEKHKEVVRLTRKLKWYKEELFARFIPYKFSGVWKGKNVENLLDV
jgi:heme-degrading monooxygenase HmoA